MNGSRLETTLLSLTKIHVFLSYPLLVASNNFFLSSKYKSILWFCLSRQGLPEAVLGQDISFSNVQTHHTWHIWSFEHFVNILILSFKKEKKKHKWSDTYWIELNLCIHEAFYDSWWHWQTFQMCGESFIVSENTPQDDWSSLKMKRNHHYFFKATVQCQFLGSTALNVNMWDADGKRLFTVLAMNPPYSFCAVQIFCSYSLFVSASILVSFLFLHSDSECMEKCVWNLCHLP